MREISLFDLDIQKPITAQFSLNVSYVFINTAWLQGLTKYQ